MITLVLGVVFAIGSMFCFAGSKAFISRPLLAVDPGTVTYISLVVGSLEAFLLVEYFGQLNELAQLTIPILALFAAIGVLHYVLSRLFGYTAIRNIGANQVASITTTQVIFASVPAVFLLGETINSNEIIGSALVIGGVGLLQATLAAKKRGGNARRGFTAAILTALIYGITTNMISFGLGKYHYFLPATLVAYLAGTAIFVPLTHPVKVMANLRRFPGRNAELVFAAGMVTVTAQILQFGALSAAPIVIVSPIIATSPVLVVIMTRLIARDVEVFHGRTLMGITLAALGAVLVTLPNL